MSHSKLLALVGILVLAAIVLNGTVYSVDQREKAIVTRFGKVIRSNDKPGLHVKTPFLDTVHFFDARILNLDTEPQQFLTMDKKNVVVDSYVKWRIADVLKFYVSVGGSELEASERLSQVVNSGLRNQFGKRTINEVISGDRSQIMGTVTAEADKEAADYGIQVVDVRVERVELPDTVSNSVFERMRAERTRKAKQARAEGAEQSEIIRANADRQREILLADAYRDAQRIRGEGDAKASAVYARAYRLNPQFYAFYRSLHAYRESFKNKNDLMLLGPNSDFFKYLKNPRQ